MNRNVVIILIGGFLIAVLVAIMVQAMLGGGKKQEVSQERMQILVAAKDLKVGKIISPGDFKWQAWPEDAMFVGAVIRDGQQGSGEAVRGKLLRSLSEGEPLHMTLVVEDDGGEFLAANVAKGMRAVSVPLSKSALADRLMRPGDFVDVLVTYRVRLNSRSNPEAQSLVNRYATETVIENVRILAIDTNDTKAVDEIESDDKKKRKTSSKQATLTLEVNPEQAEGLLLAKTMGTLGIALRSIGDNGEPPSDQATTDVGMSRVMTKLSSMTGASSAIRVYSGAELIEARGRSSGNDDTVNFDVEDEPQPPSNIIISPEALEGISDEE